MVRPVGIPRRKAGDLPTGAASDSGTTQCADQASVVRFLDQPEPGIRRLDKQVSIKNRIRPPGEMGTKAGPAASNLRGAFRLVASQCFATMQQHCPAASRGVAEDIHRTRMALTTLRATQKLFRPALTQDDSWEKLEADVRWLNQAMGAARDADVLLAQSGTWRADEPAHEKLERHAAREHRRLAAVLGSTRYSNLIGRLKAWIEEESANLGSARHSLANYVGWRLRRWKQRMTRRDRHPFRTEPRRHRLRIAAKRWRYMRETFTALGLSENAGERKDRKAILSIHRAIGDLRDLQKFKAGQAKSVPRGEYRRRKRKLLKEAKKAMRRLRTG